MGYDEQQANRVREALIDAVNVTEKRMFGGLCFMVDDKLCICIRNADLLCRVGPDEFETALEKPGAGTMKMGSRTMKGYVYVESDAIRKEKEFHYWVNTSLAFNKLAKPSKKRKSK
jgi:TfoX/Sxy family transcriptional regulator of competence genes